MPPYVLQFLPPPLKRSADFREGGELLREHLGASDLVAPYGIPVVVGASSVLSSAFHLHDEDFGHPSTSEPGLQLLVSHTKTKVFV